MSKFVPLLLPASLSALLFTGTVAAQGELEEIVVTAEFRETNVQDTPISITAISGEMLEARSQLSIVDVANQSPNVTLRAAGQGAQGLVAFIRGIGQNDFVAALEPGVGIYVDDVYYSTLSGSVLDLLDVSRVEVLRGPQGTLAGKNSIGGAVKLYSKKPGEDAGGYAQVAYGSYNRVDLRASGDLTLIDDTLFARLSGASKSRDGYVDILDYGCTHPGSGVPILRTSNGCKVGEQGDISYTAARAALRWLPSDNLEINLSADFVNDTSGTPAGVLVYGHRAAPGGPSIDDGDPLTPPVEFTNHRFVPYGPNRPAGDPINNGFVNYSTMDNPATGQHIESANTQDIKGYTATIDWDISDMMSLTSITAYRSVDALTNQDRDMSPIGLSLVSNRTEHSQLSEEIRLNGSSSDFLDWTLGLFYFDQDNFYEAALNLNYADLNFIHGPDPTPSTTKAVFAHGVFHITDNFDASIGLRYSDEEKSYTHHRHNIDGTVAGTGGQNTRIAGLDGTTADFADSRTDWRVALNYNFTDDMMGYLSVSTGYKGGGINPRPFFSVQVQEFGPEEVLAYELGTKMTLLDNTMRLNGAIFYNDYKDIQLGLSQCATAIPPTFFGAPCALPANAGSAEVKGAEVELELFPTENLMVDASISYIDFEFTEISPFVTTITLDTVPPFTPKTSASLGLQYNFGGNITARLDATYQDDVYTSDTNAATNLIEAETVANARVWWNSPEDTWQVALEVSNLFDEYYYLMINDQAGSATLGQTTAMPALPRQYSLSIKRNF